MKSAVIQSSERTFIENILRLQWGKNADNSFIRSTQFALNALGENYSYQYLMGISGAAFRLHFDPDWCPSSVDATTGFDVSKILFRSLGYACELVKINDNSFDDIRFLYQKIMNQIDSGIPIVAVNLRGHTEWGIISGYLNDRPGILCRTYFDEADEYSLAEHAPWLSFFIGEKSKSLHEQTLFSNSLKIGVQLAKTDQFEQYKNGFSALETWIEKLGESASANSTAFKAYETNWTIFNCLLDARRAAAAYLSDMFQKYPRENSEIIVEKYQAIVNLLEQTQKEVLPSYSAIAEKWTPEILLKQTEVLEQVLKLEKEVIELVEAVIHYWSTQN